MTEPPRHLKTLFLKHNNFLKLTIMCQNLFFNSEVQIKRTCGISPCSKDLRGVEQAVLALAGARHSFGHGKLMMGQRGLEPR